MGKGKKVTFCGKTVAKPRLPFYRESMSWMVTGLLGVLISFNSFASASKPAMVWLRGSEQLPGKIEKAVTHDGYDLVFVSGFGSVKTVRIALPSEIASQIEIPAEQTTYNWKNAPEFEVRENRRGWSVTLRGQSSAVRVVQNSLSTCDWMLTLSDMRFLK